MGTLGRWSIKPNQSFNYPCAHCCRRHLCLIKALVTFESGVLQHCGLVGLCSVSLRELHSYPMNKFQSPSVPSKGCLIYKASLVKCCGSHFEVGRLFCFVFCFLCFSWLFSLDHPFSVNPPSMYSVFPPGFFWLGGVVAGVGLVQTDTHAGRWRPSAFLTPLPPPEANPITTWLTLGPWLPI